MGRRIPVVRAATIRRAQSRRNQSVPAAPATGAAAGVARQVGDRVPLRDPPRAQDAQASTGVAGAAAGLAAGVDLVAAVGEVEPVAAAGDVAVRAVAEGAQEAGAPADPAPEPVPVETGDRVVLAGWPMQPRQVGWPATARPARMRWPVAPEFDRPGRLKPWPSRRRAGAP